MRFLSNSGVVSSRRVKVLSPGYDNQQQVNDAVLCSPQNPVLVKRYNTQFYCNADTIAALLEPGDSVFAPPGEYHIQTQVFFTMLPDIRVGDEHGTSGLLSLTGGAANGCVISGVINELQIREGVNKVFFYNLLLGQINEDLALDFSEVRIAGFYFTNREFNPNILVTSLYSYNLGN